MIDTSRADPVSLFGWFVLPLFRDGAPPVVSSDPAVAKALEAPPGAKRALSAKQKAEVGVGGRGRGA